MGKSEAFLGGGCMSMLDRQFGVGLLNSNNTLLYLFTTGGDYLVLDLSQ